MSVCLFIIYRNLSRIVQTYIRNLCFKHLRNYSYILFFGTIYRIILKMKDVISKNADHTVKHIQNLY